MKQQRQLSLWLVALVGCAAVTSVACSDDVGSIEDTGAAGSGGSATTTAGTGTSGSVSSAGTAMTAGGTGTAGSSMVTAGTAATAGTGGSTSGGSGGSANGGSAGSTSGGSGGSAGGSSIGPFGIVSCQPAFETACKPPIEFVNGDPTGRGKVFTDVIPDVVKTEQDIACTACSILYRSPDEIPANKHPKKIRLVLDEHGGVAQAGGDQIQFDLNYINGYKDREPAVIKQEMMGVLQHETVHLYQNYGTGGTGEGLADLVRARTGYYPQSRWRSEGDWKTAYTASGNFYSWLTGPCSFHSKHYANSDLDFPYKMNKALAGKSGDASFDAVAALIQQLFNKDVDTLWDEYQADAYGK
ncbi:MAG TPA: basic secretory protein-like protein [Polyangiaceae bacterium]|nr:basic secretory protein-like protein [Polyangiaceae bacterium]